MTSKTPKLTLPRSTTSLEYPAGQVVKLSKTLRELARTDTKEALVVHRDAHSCRGCLLNTLTFDCVSVFVCFNRADGQWVKLIANPQTGEPK